MALHRRDWPLATGAAPSDAEFEALEQYAKDCGAPTDVAAEAIAAVRARRAWNREARAAGAYRPAGRDRRWPTGLRYVPFEPARDVASMKLDGIDLLHLPGHTPGNVVVWVPSERWLFSGDQLLPGITPTPALQGHLGFGAPDWRLRSFPLFLDGLRRLAALGPVRCYPGHGEPFDNPLEVIVSNVQQAEQRIERARAVLCERGRISVFELAEELYPRAVRRRFWQIIATIQGLLDELEQRGEASRVPGDPRLYQAASSSTGAAPASTTSSAEGSHPISASERLMTIRSPKPGTGTISNSPG